MVIQYIHLEQKEATLRPECCKSDLLVSSICLDYHPIGVL